VEMKLPRKMSCENENCDRCASVLALRFGVQCKFSALQTDHRQANQTTNFWAAGRMINMTVDGQGPHVFKIRGFSYSNSRIGEGAPTDDNPSGWDSLQRPEICAQDFELMRKINVNALKVCTSTNGWPVHFLRGTLIFNVVWILPI
jgi:hypothetical protein